MIPVHHDFCHSVFHGVPVPVPTFQAVQAVATESSQAREVFAAPKYRRGGSCLGQTKVRWSDVVFYSAWLTRKMAVFSCVFICFLLLLPDSRISASFIPRSLDSSSAVSVSHQQHSCKRAGTCCSFKRCNFPVQNVCFVWTPCIPPDIEFLMRESFQKLCCEEVWYSSTSCVLSSKRSCILINYTISPYNHIIIAS